MTDLTTRHSSRKLCECGCGQPAPIATYTNRNQGYVKGQPVRFIHGHNGRKTFPVPEPKHCECGCGQITPIATRSNRERGWVRGQHLRFIQGHNNARFDDSPEGYKRCSSCQTQKPLSEFGYRAGKGKDRQCYCSDCRRSYERKYNKANRSRNIEYGRDYYARNREKVIASNLASQRRHPEKTRARRAVSKAVERGKFPPAWTMVCSVCQEAQAAHWHHHRGYGKEYRLDVIALCTECHGREHQVNE